MSGRRKRRAKTQSVKAKKKQWINYPSRVRYGPSRFSGLMANLLAFEEIVNARIRYYQHMVIRKTKDIENFATLPKSDEIE